MKVETHIRPFLRAFVELAYLRLFRDGESGGDVGEVTQSLREVAEQLVMLSIVFLREEAQIVPRSDGPVEHASRLVETILTCQALDQPERAGHEGSLLAAFAPVAPNQAVVVEFLADSLRSTNHAFVLVIYEIHLWQKQERGVQLLAAESLNEHPAFLVVSLAFDGSADLVSGVLPLLYGGLAYALLGQAEAPVERGPAHDLRVHEVSGFTTHLPYPLVGSIPELRGILYQLHKEAPVVIVRGVSSLVPAPG